MIKNIQNITEAIRSVQGLRIGHAESSSGKTGVTVLWFPEGARVGCHISGGGPASRETPLTFPETADNPVDAIVLSGGSAYGLAASDGVMRCFEEHGIGYDTGVCRVPLVLQSCIFDLAYGSPSDRPDASLGYLACSRALQSTDGRQGNIGGGAGATAGKLYGMKRSVKSGLGLYSAQVRDLQMTAVVIVNAFGDIFDPETGNKAAGLLSEDRRSFSDTSEELIHFMDPRDQFTGNTTIGAVITNGEFSKAEMNKIASMAQNAYARCIRPAGTMADGDTVYAASVGGFRSGANSSPGSLSGAAGTPAGIVRAKADINFAGTLAARVMQEAILSAVRSSAGSVSEEEFLKNCL